MKDLLDKFSSRPGQKVYESPAVTEEKIHLEAKLMKKAASQEHSIFSGHSFTVSPKQLKKPHLSASKQKVNNNVQIVREMREKSLSELLFERFKAKLPEIQERRGTYGGTKTNSKNRQQLVDNSFNRRKIYDAWDLSP